MDVLLMKCDPDIPGTSTLDKYEKQIELLFLESSERFLHGAHNYAAEADFFEENLEQALETFVVIHHEHSGLAGLVFLQNILVERRLFDAPTAPNLNGRELATLHQVINGRQRNPQVFRSFFDR